MKGDMTVMSIFYVFAGFCNVFQGLFRGVAKLQITFIAIIVQIFLRVALSYILSPYLGIPSVCYAIGIGWILMIIYEGLECKKYFKEITETRISIYTEKCGNL